MFTMKWLLPLLFLTSPCLGANFTVTNYVPRSGGEMYGPLEITGSSLTVVGSSRDTYSLLVTTSDSTNPHLMVSTMGFVGINTIPTSTFTVIGKVEFRGELLSLSSATDHPASYLQIGKNSQNTSIITNSNVSGAVDFMPGKANPQILMGDAASTGSGFIDMSSGRPLFIQSLSSGTVTIGEAGVAISSSGHITAPASSTATLVNLVVTGKTQPGISFSTQTSAGAGAVTTATCPTNFFVLNGGCSCTGALTVSNVVNMPSPTLTVAGSMPTGWQCQETGLTGGACAAYAVCSRIQK